MSSFQREGSRKTPVVSNPKVVAQLVAAGWSVVEVTEPGVPRGNASREEWAAYADSLGIEVSKSAKRDDIKNAVAFVLAESDEDDEDDFDDVDEDLDEDDDLEEDEDDDEDDDLADEQ